MAVIRVSGHPGAGKTTFCALLAEKLKYEYFYAGKLFRELAAQAGLPIEEYYQRLAADPRQEAAIDDRQRELMASRDNMIIEGRIAPFLPCVAPAINMLLTVDPMEGARRQQLRPENAARNVQEIHARTVSRITHEREHYRTLYGINDHFNPEHYDIVLDTTTRQPQETLAAALQELSKKSIYPPTS